MSKDLILQSPHLTEKEKKDVSKYSFLSKYIPFEFENKATINQLDCHCDSCKAPIKKENLFGKVNMLTKVACISAFGYCDKCDRVIRTVVRIYDDFRIVEYINGEWVAGTMEKEESKQEKLLWTIIKFLGALLILGLLIRPR